MAYQPLQGMNVLIVENDKSNAEALEALLEVNGANVVGIACAVEDAETLLPLPTPCVAIVDYHLGIATCEPLIKLLEEEKVPFVVVTAWSLNELPRSFASKRVVMKPYNFNDLVQVLADAVQAHADQAMGR